MTARCSSRLAGSDASSTATASAPANDWPARIAEATTCRLSASWRLELAAGGAGARGHHDAGDDRRGQHEQREHGVARARAPATATSSVPAAVHDRDALR